MAANWNSFLGSALSGLGGGLMSAGTPGGNIGQGFMGGSNNFQQQLQEQQLRQMREQQMQFQQEQADAARSANADAAADKQKIRALIGGGLMTTTASAPNGMSQAQFGGAPQGQQMPQSLFDPQTAQQIQSLPYEMQKAVVEQRIGQMFAPKEQKAPSVEDGMFWDGDSFEPVPGWLEQQMQLRQAGASKTTVNNNVGQGGIDYGDPPKDMAWARNPDNSVKLDDRGIPVALPIQNTPLAQDTTKIENADANRAAAAAQTADVVTTDINRALETMDKAILPTTGFTGSALSNVPNTASHDVSKLIMTVKGNIGIDKLQAMRAQSPTGGALGNVTEGELATLQSTLGNLEQSQSDDQFRENLKRVYNTYLDTVHGKGKGPDRYPVKTPKGPDGGGGELRYDAQGNPM